MTLQCNYLGPLGRFLGVVAGLIVVVSCGGGSNSAPAPSPTPTPAAAPSFSVGSGTYASAQMVTISDATAGATIYYTTNGATPTTSSTQYTGAITVSSTETIEAIATASGYSTSAMASATYTITPAAATPSFSVESGTYTSAQTVTISDATAGATIYYTTNGATPTTGSTQYTGAITVSSTETIEAIATASGYSTSAVASATYTMAPAAKNEVAIEINLGPDNDYVNGLFTSVEVCAPGSTSNCITVPDVLVDTGSIGLRLLSGALGGLSLPTVRDSSGNDVQECVQFISLAYIWGPVAQADIHLAGETASSAPIHIISESPQYSAPSSCLSLGTSGAIDYNSLAALGANGILGVGNLPQDCGSACTSASNDIPQYFVCPGGDCQITSVSTEDQVSNPVALFSHDNNGVLVSLPTVPAGGAATASGSLIFGIATQSNNALGSAKIFATTDEEYFTTTYNGTAYPKSFIDSGSNGLYFLDSATLGNLDCANDAGFYCPASTLNFTVTNTGANGTSAPISFSIDDADTLFDTGFAAFNDLGGDSGTSPSTDYFDFGIPFFYGRNVFVGIAGTSVPNGASAPNGYWAF